jgi:HK97 gp10 family phage protein
MASTTVRVDGLRELQKALAELPKSTSRTVQRRVLMKRAQPIADAMRAKAPKRYGDLRDSITVSTKRPRGHKSNAARAFAAAGGGAAGRAAVKAAGGTPVEVFVGPGRNPQALMQEFGTRHHGPQPFIRPSWDAEKDRVLEGLKDDLWTEIQKAAARLAKKRAKG